MALAASSSSLFAGSLSGLSLNAEPSTRVPADQITTAPFRISCVGGGSQVRSTATATPTKTKRSKVEIFKEQSNFLRWPLNDDLLNENANVSEASTQIIKFHGSYQQYDRDVKQSKNYSFMLRTKQPAGKVTNQLYLAMDELADEFGIGSLRLTTRQTFQLHGVLKRNLKTVMSTVIKNMGSTLGACGDLNRNVLAPPVPYHDKPDYVHAVETAEKIAALLAPQAGAYYDMWVDGEKIMSAEPPDVTEARNTNINGTNFENCPEPIYGVQFLPRKFKVAVTVPGDNSVDLFTNDVGIVVIMDDAGELQGYNVYVGGGMGRTHRIQDTFPRLAEPLGFVPKDDILYAVKAIVATQRDNGRRDDRRYSRLKYLINDWGIEKFKLVTEQYYGKTFQPLKDLPPWEFKSYLGWGEQGDGRLFYGLHVENGRITGELKKTLREIIETYNLSVRISANQNLILCDVRQAWRPKINKLLAAVGVQLPRSIDPLNVTSLACPALPLCPLAITEAERGAPAILERIRASMKKVGLGSKQPLVVRFTGCPNGCTRPYMAELGLVGDGPNSYQLWVGGTTNQTRLAQTFLEKVKVQELEKVLEPLFHYWKTERSHEDESFGDFAMRLGLDTLKNYLETFEGLPKKKKAGPKIINVNKDLYAALDKIAESEGTSITSLAAKVLSSYVDSAPTAQ
ncbi:hypothetical protein R1sor_007512 [Riccia sorocarpa]|uniref:assimilatory sulfite reductase (ferredoxin) n=1 Tax=Riccia sorocarpa TaxID=122646 RepID=A0ABD3HSU7_9MARC